MEFCTTKNEAAQCHAIATRAVKLAAQYGVDYSFTDAVMDIEACHCNGNPLDLAQLLVAREFDFAHDVFGIRRHINRETGELKDCFSPRHSARASLAKARNGS